MLMLQAMQVHEQQQGLASRVAGDVAEGESTVSYAGTEGYDEEYE